MNQTHQNRSTRPNPPSLPDRQAAIAHHMAALENLADPAARSDGWTPFARRLFLQVVAETGRVSTACQYAGLSKQSAYALRARDPIFAAGWGAACELARMPLADALYEQALDGLTDTITRDDGRTVTRHRFDSRLSIAVLNRLDRRCDRDADRGSNHAGAVGRWDDFTSAIGRDDQDAALAILDAAQTPVSSEGETAKPGQPSQLGEVEDDEQDEVAERLWWDDDRDEWRTDFPPPPGFAGNEAGEVGGWRYHRSLTGEELELVKRDCAAADEEDRAADQDERDRYFAEIRASLSNATNIGGTDEKTTARHPGLDPGSAFFSIDPASEADPGSEAGVTSMASVPLTDDGGEKFTRPVTPSRAAGKDKTKPRP